MLPPSSYYNIYYHILQYNKTKYLTKNYRLYAACRHFSYFGTVKDPITFDEEEEVLYKDIKR